MPFQLCKRQNFAKNEASIDRRVASQLADMCSIGSNTQNLALPFRSQCDHAKKRHLLGHQFLAAKIQWLLANPSSPGVWPQFAPILAANVGPKLLTPSAYCSQRLRPFEIL